jgi:hypothetical protein
MAANTTTTTGQPTSWAGLYGFKRTEIASLKAVFDEPFESFNNITADMKEGVDLAITIASRPYNFLILTSESNQVNLLHTTATTQPKQEIQQESESGSTESGDPSHSKLSTQLKPCWSCSPQHV